MANAGRVLTRDVLIDRIWGPNYFGDTKTLDVHIKRLRSKIEPDPAQPEPHRDGARRRLPLRARRRGDRVDGAASTSPLGNAVARSRCSVSSRSWPGSSVLVTVGLNLFGIGALAVGVIDLAWTVA